MDTVENFAHKPPVRIGIGKNNHVGALLMADAENTIVLPGQADLLGEHAAVTIRGGDTLVVVEPSVLKLSLINHLQKVCGGDLLFQVVGHPARKLATVEDIADFKKLRARGVGGDIVKQGGRPRAIKYTLQQANKIIDLWHETPRVKLSEVCRLAAAILDVDEVKQHWVRDLVKKYVGTAQRDRPEGWTGIKLDDE